MKPFILIVSSFLLSSCMHLGMMTHSEADHSSAPESIPEKKGVRV